MSQPYNIQFHKIFQKSLSKLDRVTARRVLGVITFLSEADDPTGHLKPLTGTKSGLWSKRVGNYRIIMDVRKSEMILLALDVGHRSEIYDRRYPSF